jgi:Domain of unknown function (4846)
MQFKLTILLLMLSSFSCSNNTNSKTTKKNVLKTSEFFSLLENDYLLIKNIPLPAAYECIQNEKNSFAAWLENVALKKDKTVYIYDGSPKHNQTAQFAVLDISVGKKNLQQCADAVMRLRAEYLFSQKKFEEIIFRDNVNGLYKFMQPYTKENLIIYLDIVFGMCGTASLSKQLKAKSNFNELEAGNVLIRGGFPGHAVIVMDVAINKEGNKIYLLAQSYMPAQDIHVLQNPTNEKLSPWYEINDEDLISTPEYLFYKKELMQW